MEDRHPIKNVCLYYVIITKVEILFAYHVTELLNELLLPPQAAIVLLG
jgi:hypothetical protein